MKLPSSDLTGMDSMSHSTCRAAAVLLVGAFLFQLPTTATAEDPLPPVGGGAWSLGVLCNTCAAPCADGRQFSIRFSPYGWLTQMHGEVGARSVTAPLDISMGKMWDLDTHDLDFAFLGQLEASYGRFGFLANGAFFELSPGASIRNLDFGSRVSETALDLDFTYTLFGNPETTCGCPSFHFDLIAGVRYYSLTGDLTITGPRDNAVSISGARDWTDLVVGGRFIIPLNDKWSLFARGDYGGFGINGCSQAAWNVELLASYRWSESVSFFAGYRWMDVNYDRGEGRDRFKYDVQTDGPLVGLTIKF
jgi:hypothetical protein